MILLANLMIGIAQILDGILMLMVLLVVARVIISWVNADPYNPIVRFISSATDPLINVLRRKMRLTIGALDFAPVVLLFALVLLRVVVAQSLLDYGSKLRMEALVQGSVLLNVLPYV